MKAALIKKHKQNNTDHFIHISSATTYSPLYSQIKKPLPISSLCEPEPSHHHPPRNISLPQPPRASEENNQIATILQRGKTPYPMQAKKALKHSPPIGTRALYQSSITASSRKATHHPERRLLDACVTSRDQKIMEDAKRATDQRDKCEG